MKTKFIIGSLKTLNGDIPVVTATLSSGDIIGAVKARWAINRNDYKISPGLYALGSPTENSHVFVTANYKLSFDHLRKNLHEIDCWILVLDTKGINVWCAAGKGTFGTEELVNRIHVSGLDKTVNHKRLILPQLGAVGVSAHEVKKQTGFSVIYGPVRATDISEFLRNQMKASREMRTVYFNFCDRIKLIPVEIVGHSRYVFFTMASFIILAGLNSRGYSLDNAFAGGLHAVWKILAAFFCGAAVMPMLLPVIPVKNFSLKGAIIGLLAALGLMVVIPDNGIFETLSWFFIIPAISAFISMNFTGTSTYTSLSGVLKEMKYAIPLQLAFSFIGLTLWIISRFVN